MRVLNVADVNEALPLALSYLYAEGETEQTRNGPAVVAPTPVATVYRYPRRRVLFDPHRDANPFFHLFESLWILAGQRDVKFLSWFNSRIAQYSDDGEVYHAPYGYRLRKHFGTDQIAVACDMLRKDPNTRRAVLQIWDTKADMGVQSKDLPCNDMVMLRVRKDDSTFHNSGRVLDITVCNRSNDAVWGAYGANVVQFSMLQEYMAAAINVGIGTYTQVSNNLHVYEDNPYWQHWVSNGRSPLAAHNGYAHPLFASEFPMLDSALETIHDFDLDLAMFFNMARAADTLRTFTAAILRVFSEGSGVQWRTVFFQQVVQPMLVKYMYRESMPAEFFTKIDWHLAAHQWIKRREAKRGAKL
jgi:hypothetical protein